MPFGRTLFRTALGSPRLCIQELYSSMPSSAMHHGATGGSCPSGRLEDLDPDLVALLEASVTARMRSFEICEMCSRPSVPGMISTKAPKSTILRTLPL